MPPETMAARLVDPAGIDRANTARRMVGSTRAATVISREAPMPPKAVPVSRPSQGQRHGAEGEQRHHEDEVGADAGRGGGGGERHQGGHHGGAGHQQQRCGAEGGAGADGG
ncbi:hypothetical protein GCM10020000_71590 [Streptomyces olivoverticillatus]